MAFQEENLKPITRISPTIGGSLLNQVSKLNILQCNKVT